MLTWFSWPMRCTRSSACMMSPGTQLSSANTTVLAAVSVRPTPAAVMPSTATCAHAHVTKQPPAASTAAAAPRRKSRATLAPALPFPAPTSPWCRAAPGSAPAARRAAGRPSCRRCECTPPARTARTTAPTRPPLARPCLPAPPLPAPPTPAAPPQVRPLRSTQRQSATARATRRVARRANDEFPGQAHLGVVAGLFDAVKQVVVVRKHQELGLALQHVLNRKRGGPRKRARADDRDAALGVVQRPA